MTLVCLVAAALAVVGGASPALAAPSTFQAPVYSGDFPDPSVIVSGGSYWAYATGTGGLNLQVMSSANLRAWTTPVDPLPTLPSWASAGLTWAPGVLQVHSRYVMYYTVHDPTLGEQCISVATSDAPKGPFTDSSSQPLVCQTSDGGSIDPNPYVDPSNGTRYLLWKSDDNSLGAGHPTHIWGQALASDATSFAAATTPSLLLTESAPWQEPTAEGPAVIDRAGRYYLFYGANNYDTANSGIGYATSMSLLGTYANASIDGPWLASRGNAQGPQGPDVFKDLTGTTRMAFAAWDGPVGYEHGGVRSLWLGELKFSRAGPPIIS
jgi:beta-xylosidase